jgi:hypothetical protein
MLMFWMIASTLIYSASLAIWMGIFGLSFMAFDSGFAIGPALFVTAVGLYSVVALGSIIWGWIALKREERRRAGLIMLAPIAYVALIALILQIGIWIQG